MYWVPDDVVTPTVAISWADADAKTSITNNRTSFGVSLELFFVPIGHFSHSNGADLLAQDGAKSVIVLGEKETALPAS